MVMKYTEIKYNIFPHATARPLGFTISLVLIKISALTTNDYIITYYIDYSAVSSAAL